MTSPDTTEVVIIDTGNMTEEQAREAGRSARKAFDRALLQRHHHTGDAA